MLLERDVLLNFLTRSGNILAHRRPTVGQQIQIQFSVKDEKITSKCTNVEITHAVNDNFGLLIFEILGCFTQELCNLNQHAVSHPHASIKFNTKHHI